MSKKFLERVLNILSTLVLVIALLFFLFPIFWMFMTSIKTPFDTFAIPPVWFFKPTWENYINTFVNNAYYKYLWNSFFVTSVSILIATLISALAAYATSRFPFRGKHKILLSMLVFYTVPGISYAIPLYVLFSKLKIYDTPVALITIFTALTIPFATWVLHGYFVSIPRELEDSAMVDGCSRIQALFKIVMPLATPGIAATAILTFISTWNNFLYPAILAGSKTKTMPVAVAAFITDTRIEWGQAAAVSTAIMIPVLVLIIFTQKFIVQGLVAGAVKE